MPYPPFRGKVYPPRAVALFTGKITCGRCTFTLLGGKGTSAKTQLLENTLLRHSKSQALATLHLPNGSLQAHDLQEVLPREQKSMTA